MFFVLYSTPLINVCGKRIFTPYELPRTIARDSKMAAWIAVAPPNDNTRRGNGKWGRGILRFMRDPDLLLHKNHLFIVIIISLKKMSNEVFELYVRVVEARGLRKVIVRNERSITDN